MKAALLLAALLAAAGCARFAARAERGASDPALARERMLLASPGFSAHGRIALRRNGRGATGHFRWIEAEQGFELVLSSPGGGPALRLWAHAGRACLEGRPEGPICGKDPERVLARVLEAPVPLRALSWWLRGAPAPGSRSHTRWGGDSLPIEIRQRGWRIRYPAWYSAMTPPMPRLIEAERQGVRVRVAVSQWGQP